MLPGLELRNSPWQPCALRQHILLLKVETFDLNSLAIRSAIVVHIRLIVLGIVKSKLLAHLCLEIRNKALVSPAGIVWIVPLFDLAPDVIDWNL